MKKNAVIVVLGAGAIGQAIARRVGAGKHIVLADLSPDWFTNANEIDYAITHKGEAETGTAISRKSIAAFIAMLVENPGLHNKENLGISKPN